MKARRLIKRILLFAGILFVADRIIGLILLHGITSYFDLNRKVDYLFIGSSPTVFAIDKNLLEKNMHATVALPVEQGMTSEDRLVMLKYFLSVNKSQLKGCVYELTPTIFTSEKFSDNSYQLLYPFMGDTLVRNYIRKNCFTRMEYYLRLVFITPRFIEGTFNYSIRGLLNRHESVKSGVVNVTKLRRQALSGSFRKIAFDNDCISTLNQTIHIINKNKIRGIYLVYPTVDIFNQIQKPEYYKAMVLADAMVRQAADDTVFNFDPDFDARYELFTDPIHLNSDGRKIFTERLAQEINSISMNNVQSGKGLNDAGRNMNKR